MIETKFKQTEIGLIPDAWEAIPLGELCEIRNGYTPSKSVESFWNGGVIPWFRMEDIRQNGRILSDSIQHITSDAVKGELFSAYSIILSTTATIGEHALLIADSLANQRFTNLKIRESLKKKTDIFFFYWYCYKIGEWCRGNVNDGGLLAVNISDLLLLPIPLPPINEQRRIAEVLSNIDQLISSLSKTIEKKRLIKQGAMQQLLTGKKRLPGFDGEWEKHKIGDFLSILKGYGLSKSHLVQDGKNKCILYGELFTKYDYEIKTCISRTDSDEGLLSECGDILMPSSTTTNGIDLAKAVSVYENRIHLGGDIVVLRDKKIVEYEPYFVSAKITELCKQAIEQSSQGITIIHLNTRELRKIEVTIPSTRKEQMAIVTILRTMDNEIESLEEERDKYIQLKEGMMQKLLTGQVRLVEAETIQKDLPIAKTANVYFKRSVLAAEIADRLCEERTFGHVKMEKLIFLTEHLCHIDIDSHYHRDAAGPYDNRALRSIDSQMKKQQWFAVTKKDKGYQYQPMEKRGEHKKYFDRYYSDVLPMFDTIINTFKTSSTEQCEIVATIYSAWDDLLHGGRPFSDEDILDEVLNNWHESKRRIERSRWQKALVWMRDNGFVPQTENL